MHTWEKPFEDTQWRKVKQMKKGPDGLWQQLTVQQPSKSSSLTFPLHQSVLKPNVHFLVSINAKSRRLNLSSYTTFQNNGHILRCLPNLENSKLLYPMLIRRNSGLHSLDDSEMLAQVLAFIVYKCHASNQLSAAANPALVWILENDFNLSSQKSIIAMYLVSIFNKY